MKETIIDDQLAPLLARACRGDDEAFGDLVVGSRRELRAAVAVRSPTCDLVEEVVQRTYITAWEQRRQYRGEGCVIAWLKGIARNLLAQELRQRAQQARAVGDGLDALVYDIDAASKADDQLALRRLARLRSCLGDLSPRMRRMLERHYIERVPVARLAQQFKKSVNSITMSLYRLRRSLRACIERAAS